MPAASEARILLVEDYGPMTKVTIRILNDLGYSNVTSAANGQEALDVLKTEAIDCVLADWIMPKMDGEAFLQHIRSTPELKDLPVLVISGSPSNLEAAKAAGADAVMPKPFNAKTLSEQIGSLLPA